MSSPFREVIMSLDLNSGKVEEFAGLPTGLAAHASFMLDNKYLLIYGGTNGLKFFDNVIRYDIENKEWRLMTKYPESQKNSPFFKDGRFGLVSAASPEGDDQIWVLFGGCTDAEDCKDFLVLHKSHMIDDSNFSVIT